MGELRRVAADDHAPEVREPAGYRRSESEIGTELRERLADDVGLDARGIEVEVRGREVTMRGIVRHGDDMHRAEAHACAVPGVRLVVNRLQSLVRPDAECDALGAASKMGKPSYER